MTVVGWTGPIEVWTIEGEGEFEGDYAKLSALLRLTHHSVRTMSDLVKAGGDKMSVLVSMQRLSTIRPPHLCMACADPSSLHDVCCPRHLCMTCAAPALTVFRGVH